MKKCAFFLLLLLSGASLFSQGSQLPLDNQAYHLLDRLEIKTGIPVPFHSSLKPYNRGAATRYALTIDTSRVPLTSKDRRDLFYLFRDNNEWLATTAYPTTLGGTPQTLDPERDLTQVEASADDAHYTLSKRPLFGVFYNTPANFFEVNQKYFHLRVNPLLNFNLAVSKDDDQPVFQNLRGLEMRGGVDDRIYFYFSLEETQARFPDYVNERIESTGAVPGAGFFKSYTSQIFDIKKGYDYLNGQGFVGFNFTRHVGMQLGYGRNFIGNGYRSLFLSDFSNNYLHLKLNWRVWKFHFQNIFAELSNGTPVTTPGMQLISKKYMATHHLSFDLLPNLNIGFFETVVFSREDYFDFHYLLPIILYRTVEQGLNSPDNVMIGLDGKWNLLNRFQLYGQLLIDEFVFKELFIEKRGWWANKFGIQAGLKYINAFGIDHLDLQIEHNLTRPYTYTHDDHTSNYVHYNQPLAHPLGANFRENILLARYQAGKRWQLEARLIMAQAGEDSDSTNWGSNLLLSNSRLERGYGNEIGQGIAADILLGGLDISYQLRHNVFLDFIYFYRRKDSSLAERDNTTQYVGGGVRVNIARTRWDF